MGPIRWGSVGEWAAAVGTSSAVLLTALTRRRDRNDQREQEAIRVTVGLGPSGGPPGPDGLPATYMGVTVFNGSGRTITDVNVELQSGAGERLNQWTYTEVPPGVTMSEIQTPRATDWAKRPSLRTFVGMAAASFDDADGRRWLRTSEGKIRALRGRWRQRRR